MHIVHSVTSSRPLPTFFTYLILVNAHAVSTVWSEFDSILAKICCVYGDDSPSQNLLLDDAPTEFTYTEKSVALGANFYMFVFFSIRVVIHIYPLTNIYSIPYN